MQIQECVAPLFCHYCPLGRWPIVSWVMYWWQNQHRIPVIPQVGHRSNRKCSRRELPPVRFACKVNFTESSDVIYNSVMGAFVWLVNSVFVCGRTVVSVELPSAVVGKVIEPLFVSSLHSFFHIAFAVVVCDNDILTNLWFISCDASVQIAFNLIVY